MTTKNGDMPAMPFHQHGLSTQETKPAQLEDIRMSNHMKANPSAMRIALEMVEAMKTAGIMFVPVPVFNNAEVKQKLKEVLDILEKKDGSEECATNHSPDTAEMVQDGCAVLMTLDEAIDHANEKSIGSSQCAAQHAQLAKWLTDYRAMLAAAPKLRD